MSGWEVLDTVVKIGLGAIITTIATYLNDRSRNNAVRYLEANRIRQDRIIDPIAGFIDELLLPLSETYWTHVDQLDDHLVTANVDGKMLTLRNKEAIIEARVAALGDEALSKKFTEFTQMYFRVRRELIDGKIAEARDLTHQTTKLAGEILTTLYALRV